MLYLAGCDVGKVAAKKGQVEGHFEQRQRKNQSVWIRRNGEDLRASFPRNSQAPYCSDM
jgi:hypothetical protein